MRCGIANKVSIDDLTNSGLRQVALANTFMMLQQMYVEIPSAGPMKFDMSDMVSFDLLSS